MHSLQEVLRLVRSGAWVPREPVLLLGFRPAAGGERRFRTLSSEGESRVVSPLRAVVEDPWTAVAPIAKRASSPYGDFVFVGRAVTSDIVLDDPSVSKSHAAFRREPGEPQRWSVKDNRSRNGTYVDGDKLDAVAWVALPSGAQVTFGGVAAYFVGVEQLAALARGEDG